MRILLGLGVLCLFPGIGLAGIINGGFETGDLTGWTLFDTTLGDANSAGVVSFDTVSGVPSNAAKFDVGVAPPNPTGVTFEGGGIYQNVIFAAGVVQLSVDWATQAVTFNNSGGRFNLLLDGVVVDSDTVGAINAAQIIRGSLSANAVVTAGSHEVRIEITRPFGDGPNAPRQYLDNVNAVQSQVPEPSAMVLMAAGLAGILLRRRKC